MHRLFLDANILFAASYSDNGGSAMIFKLAERQLIEIVSSKFAFAEAERNLISKGEKTMLIRFYKNISLFASLYENKLNQDAFAALKPIINSKDLPILVSAMQSKSDYLLTLDRKAFFNERIFEAAKPMIIFTPQDYIQKCL